MNDAVFHFRCDIRIDHRHGCKFIQKAMVFLCMAVYHVPNGGKRSKTEAARFKRQGVKPGVPDLVLPVPRHGFHGLYIEMKYGRNKASSEQSWWLEQLTAQGYMCVLCVGADAAIRTICDYMRIKGG